MNFFGKTRAQVNRARTVFQQMIDEYLNNDQGVPNEQISNLFVYESTFGTESVHGFAHVVHLKQEPRFKFVIKTARGTNADSLAREFEIQKHLNALHDRTPNFPVALGLFNCFTSLDNTGNFIEKKVCRTQSKNLENMTMLVMEYISDSQTLFEFIQDPTTSDKQKEEIFLQIYYTVFIAKYFQNFTHYDLHINNILVRKMNYRTTLNYTMPDNTIRTVNTDVLATIIDFGQAYSNVISSDLNNLGKNYGNISIGQHLFNLNNTQIHATIDLYRLIRNLKYPSLDEKKGRLYRMLGLAQEPSPSQEQIRKAYRAFATKYHPDKNSAKNATETFQRIQQAFEILSNTQARYQYDRTGTFNGDAGWIGIKLQNLINNMEDRIEKNPNQFPVLQQRDF